MDKQKNLIKVLNNNKQIHFIQFKDRISSLEDVFSDIYYKSIIFQTKETLTFIGIINNKIIVEFQENKFFN